MFLFSLFWKDLKCEPRSLPFAWCRLKNTRVHILELSPRNSVNSLSLINYSLYVKADRGKCVDCSLFVKGSVWFQWSGGLKFKPVHIFLRRLHSWDPVWEMYFIWTCFIAVPVCYCCCCCCCCHYCCCCFGLIPLACRLKMTDEKDINYCLQENTE